LCAEKELSLWHKACFPFNALGPFSSHQGREIGVFEPNSLTNHGLAVSTDGRFLAVASFTAEVKIWEVRAAKQTGDFQGTYNFFEPR
jgi:hypothetical protein